MSPVPVPGQQVRSDPASIGAEVDAVLGATTGPSGAESASAAGGAEMAAHVDSLDRLYQRLAAALATVDRV